MDETLCSDYQDIWNGEGLNYILHIFYMKKLPNWQKVMCKEYTRLFCFKLKEFKQFHFFCAYEVEKDEDLW